jgi:hypothetical protein
MNKEIRNDIAENETHWLVDGSRLVVANEAEIDGDEDFVLAADKSNDPLGTISIIAIANGTPADTAQSLDFTAFDAGGARASELPAEVRIGISGNHFSRDAEPEYVTITPYFITANEGDDRDDFLARSAARPMLLWAWNAPAPS